MFNNSKQKLNIIFTDKLEIFIKRSKQQLPVSVDEAWEFLSNASNLKTITADYMGSVILSGAERPMFPGQFQSMKRKPDEIFEYRRKKPAELFGEYQQ